MQLGAFQKQPQGFRAFVPDPFPPKGGFNLSANLIQKASEATLLIGKLDGITRLLPDANFFVFMYIRKDAASSNQIEGTNATMIDAIEAELQTSEKLPDDVDDILNYIDALNFGLQRLEEIPLSLRLIKELHGKLMRDARNTHFADPGNFRNSQNWIGGTKPDNAQFIPPPVHEMKQALSDLELFFHTKDTLMPVVKSGIIHGQFETIHPFLDGNGRTGRLLITFYLHLSDLLERPVLFLSWYFRKHQQLYYQRLNAYHEGDIESWLDFYLDGVIDVSKEAIETVHKITVLREKDMEKIHKLSKTSSESALKVLPNLYRLPIVNVKKIQEWTGFTRQGAQKLIDRFVDLGILQQKDESKDYGRSFIYKRYVDIFSD